MGLAGVNSYLHNASLLAADDWDDSNSSKIKVVDIFRKAQEQELNNKIYDYEEKIKNNASLWEKICINIGQWILRRPPLIKSQVDLSVFKKIRIPQCEIIHLETQRLQMIPSDKVIFKTNKYKQLNTKYNSEDVHYAPSLINERINKKASEEANKNLSFMAFTGKLAIRTASAISLIGIGTLGYFLYKNR